MATRRTTFLPDTPRLPPSFIPRCIDIFDKFFFLISWQVESWSILAHTFHLKKKTKIMNRSVESDRNTSSGSDRQRAAQRGRRRSSGAAVVVRINGVGGKLDEPTLRVFLVWALIAIIGAIYTMADSGDPINGSLLIALVCAASLGACIEAEALEFLVKR